MIRYNSGKVGNMLIEGDDHDENLRHNSILRAISGDERFLINHVKAGLPNSYTNTGN